MGHDDNDLRREIEAMAEEYQRERGLTKDPAKQSRCAGAVEALDRLQKKVEGKELTWEEGKTAVRIPPHRIWIPVLWAAALGFWVRNALLDAIRMVTEFSPATVDGFMRRGVAGFGVIVGPFALLPTLVWWLVRRLRRKQVEG